MNKDIIDYYNKRAAEYDNVYKKPERQEAIAKLGALLKPIFTGKEVLEIAAGTGYWTEVIAQTAKHILATDINDSVLEIARARNYPLNNAQFQTADLYHLNSVKKYESLFGGFILSHILLQDLPAFFEAVHGNVKPGGTVVFADNLYVDDSNLPIHTTDEQGNTYQLRKLLDGSSHLVLKNFLGEESFNPLLAGKAAKLQFIPMQYYWLLSYTRL